MKLTVKRIEKAEWAEKFAYASHLISFGEMRDPAKDRIDYALLVIDESTDQPLGYMTCLEMDSDTVYWQFGGGFPSVTKTVHAWPSYQALARFHSERYKRVFTYIENTNTAMLKMAMKVGFRICGVKVYDAKVLLEHRLEFHEL